MNEAIHLNNQAVSNLQNGNAFEACNLLTQASGIYLQICDDQLRTEHREHQIHWNDFSKKAYKKTPCNSSALSSQSNGHASDGSYMEFSNRPRIYRAGLTVCQLEPSRNLCCRSNCHGNAKNYGVGCFNGCIECFEESHICPCILSPVIWYNLGLTCQILGSEHGGAKTVDGMFYLQRSNYLYDKVLSILSTCRQMKGLSSLVMAVLNNQACIFFELDSMDQYWSFLNRLQSTEINSSQPRRHPDWGIFYSNLTALECVSKQITACAA